MKVAVASSGLGHIRRGIETWASDLGEALHRRNVDVTLFAGDGIPDASWKQTIRCSKRFDSSTRRAVSLFSKLGGWRYGFGSGYQMEQTTFALKLWKRIRKDYDLLHVQDPWIALLLEKLHRKGLSRPKVILAHGTEEDAAFLQQFSALQHLAPPYLKEWEAHRPKDQQAFAIGNFVNTEIFRPADGPIEKAELRRKWGVPENALVFLCVAAIKSGHKRMDALIEEFQQFSRLSHHEAEPFLLIAGAREDETEEIIALGAKKLGARVKFLVGVPREDIPNLYRMADAFVLASLHEMMPIAVLEALASGLPVALNSTPTLCWMSGHAGDLNDISLPGALAAQLQVLSINELRAQKSCEARAHAVNTFSEKVVMKQIFAMYEQTLEFPKLA